MALAKCCKSWNVLLGHLGSEVPGLVGVVPADVLAQDRLQEEAPDLVDLALGRVVQAGHEDVAHHEVDEADTAGPGACKDTI